ncbi:RICIN domain-containing protein [Candidatus Sumerlaeota bacterium]|nr:RICIN domain-containing protein [Candidatus Sumerlaeota bacterium]
MMRRIAVALAVSFVILIMAVTSQAQTGNGMSILNLASGKAMDAYGNSNGSNVLIWDYWGGTNQRWNVASLGDGLYSIRSLQSGNRSLDCWNFGTANGTNIALYTYYGNACQKFYLTKTVASSYRITPSHATAQCVDAYGTSSGSNVGTWSYWGGTNQQWCFGVSNSSITLNPGEDIQAALDTYQTVNLRAGTWTLSEPLYINAGNTLNGAGMSSTILRGPNSTYTYSLIRGSYIGSMFNITIKNLKLDGWLGGEHGINIGGTTNLRVENVWCLNMKGMGVSCGQGVNAYYNNVVCENCGRVDMWHNWYNRNVYGGSINNSVCKNSPNGVGMKLSVGNDWTLNGCTFSGNVWDGLCTQDKNYRVSILNCSAYNNGSKGMYVYANDGSLIQYCTAYNNGSNGIYVNSNDTGDTSWIRNCTAYGNVGNQIETHGYWAWDGIY